MDGLLMNADDNDSEGKDGEGQALWLGGITGCRYCRKIFFL
jgi:hypothetical protein